jgi:4-phospho-D-threonate 3-dehydrogenase / 4-phospho-D-erythronate 3-dehydrogenase
MKERNQSLNVAISTGDIHGVGPEIILSAFQEGHLLKWFTPIIFDPAGVLPQFKSAYPDLFQEFVCEIRPGDSIRPRKINLIGLPANHVTIKPGQRTPEGANFAVQSLRLAIQSIKDKQCDFLVTGPLDKTYIADAGIPFPGHTEFLGVEFKGNPQMIMVAGQLRVGLLTGHMPLEQVVQSIRIESIVKSVLDLNATLKADFQVRRPKIAVLALNPHAGDNGKFGTQEKEIIQPALDECVDKHGLLVFGPFASDGFFGSAAFKHYDGVLSMYHDQGLTAFKALAGFEGVNYTGGLDIVRTSPDHGPAFNLAGKGLADPTSFREALFLGREVFINRSLNQELHQNPLPVAPVNHGSFER